MIGHANDIDPGRQKQLAELAQRVEAGETIVVTRDDKPVMDIIPHREKRGLDLEAGRKYLRAKGIVTPPLFVADDFDEPLPEDILLRPFP